MAESSQHSQKRINHTWTAEEDKILVECLMEIGLAWKGDNGFKSGFAIRLEKMIHARIPGCALKANPHITSRIKLLKRHYNAIVEMTGPTGGSGFGWNDKDKMIVVDKEIYSDWLKTHPNAKGLYNKPFPHFDQLGLIFGKDVATGNNAEGPLDAEHVMDKEAAAVAESGIGVDDYYDWLGDHTEATTFDPTIVFNATEEANPQSPVSTAAVKRGKKRARSEDALVINVTDTMKELAHSYQRSNDNIDKLVSSLSQPAEEISKMGKVLDELKKFEVLTVQQRVDIATTMGKDSNLTDIFMHGGDEEKHVVVLSLLGNR